MNNVFYDALTLWLFNGYITSFSLQYPPSMFGDDDIECDDDDDYLLTSSSPVQLQDEDEEHANEVHHRYRGRTHVSVVWWWLPKVIELSVLQHYFEYCLIRFKAIFSTNLLFSWPFFFICEPLYGLYSTRKLDIVLPSVYTYWTKNWTLTDLKSQTQNRSRVYLDRRC